jgi:hypothetical protein
MEGLPSVVLNILHRQWAAAAVLHWLAAGERCCGGRNLEVSNL